MKQMEQSKSGSFIVLEGLDRTGKTTQSKMLVETLNENGIDAVYMRYPDRTTTIGRVINDYLRDTQDLHDKAIHLLYSANRWELW